MSNCVNFPSGLNEITSSKTMVFLVVLNPIDIACEITDNVYNTINFSGTFLGDENTKTKSNMESCIDDMIVDQIKKEHTHNYYFPDLEMDDDLGIFTQSLPLLSTTLIGTSNRAYEYSDGTFWICDKNNLNEHGNNLYNTLKDFYMDSDSEIKILTFLEDK